MTDQLKPCPFCGGDDIDVREVRDCDWQYVAHCRECEAEGPVEFADETALVSDARSLAAATWNARPAEDSLRAERDAMRAVVDAAVQWHRNETTHGGPLERELERAVDAYLASKETDHD